MAGKLKVRSPPPQFPEPCLLPRSFLFRPQSTCRCGAVGHNQGAQVRNGAWQPLACTRLPECNFPVITLPNFSASVKDHLLTQWSQARAGWEARPFARNHFQQAEKTHSLFPFRHAQCPQETSRARRWLRPARSPGAGHPVTLSPAPTLPAGHQPRVSASPLSPVAVSLVLSPPPTRSSTYVLAGRVCQSLVVTFIG